MKLLICQRERDHLRDAIRELRDYTSEAVANRRVRDVWVLIRHLFTDTVCRALKIHKPRLYDDSRLVRQRSPSRPNRHLSPTTERRNDAYEEEEARRIVPSRHVPRRDLLLDEADKRELEALERQTADDNQLIKNVEARAVERAEKERKIVLAVQLNKEATLLQRKKQLHFGDTDTQVNLVKAAASTAPKARVVQIEQTSKPDFRKRKAEKSSSGEDVLCLNVEKEDYCEPPVASTSRQALFGPETPPKTPSKEWQRETVDGELRRKSRRDKASSPKEAKSSSRRHISKKDRPNPYAQLTKLDSEQLATALRLQSTTGNSGEAAAQPRDESPKPSAARTIGLTSPDGSPEPYEKRDKTRRVAHIPRF